MVLLPSLSGAPPSISPVTGSKGHEVLGALGNEFIRVDFIPALRAGKSSVQPRIQVKSSKGWITAPLDPSAESYQILSGSAGVRMSIAGFYPEWPTDAGKEKSRVVWNAGRGEEAIARSVTQVDERHLKILFHRTSAGSLEALWELPSGEKSIRVELIFTPSADGAYSLGYFLFNRKPLDGVESLLMPMLVQGKRFPSKEYTLLQTQSPTPVSLMQIGVGADALSWGVSGDRTSTPFEFPIPAKSRYGLHIRNAEGNVQPSLYGPLLGTPDAEVKKRGQLRFSFRVLVLPGDWYAAYRTVADEVFGWSDYRSNWQVSLTQAALNMIDLYMDDEHGGWWDRAKAPYQVESKNGSTQSSPLTAVSLYHLTGDPEVYRRRTLPTIEFMLSRSDPHFSPVPEDTGNYAKGSMTGPVNIYGSTTYGGLWEIMNRRTSRLEEIAFPVAKLRGTTTQQGFKTHNQHFDELLGRYLFLGDTAALDEAVAEADEYIAKSVTPPPVDEPGINPFFLMAYVPAWEGLLRLYEVTREKRFLDASVEGAHLAMTGFWTQPTPVMGEITIHPGGFLHGDKMDHLLHKGSEPFRLGWPRPPGDTPERKVPGWLVSNVGLGFEQPTTYTYKENGGRMILQAPWAPAFLRLAQYTGDRQFETYARNAVVGRWANYPGYYYTDFTDLAQNPRYPYEGPDIGFFYYHHIIVHLSWVIDYLVSEASLRSHGAIRFPAVRQFGYAYFDNMLYGHMPGEVLGQKEMWLWLRKDLVSLDNPQINYLTAHGGDKFLVILMNESRKQENVTVTFHPSQISKGSSTFTKARLLTEGNKEIPLSENAATITVGPRGLAVLEVEGLEIDVPAHHIPSRPKASDEAGFLTMLGGDGTDLHAAAIQIEPGCWDAYVWSTAPSGVLREISLTWAAGEKKGVIRSTEYPYEFSVPVPPGERKFRFQVSGIKADGSAFKSEEGRIGVGD